MRRPQWFRNAAFGVLGLAALAAPRTAFSSAPAAAPADAQGRSAPQAVSDGPAVLSLGRALALAEQTSPDLKAAQAREAGAHEATRVAQSGYFPTLDLAAVDSVGFPGSATGLDGFAGVAASPYREGPSADAFSQWNLVDASVWYAASAARYEADASHEFTRVQKAQVDEQALKVYLEAVLYRGNQQAWATLVGSLKGVRDTVDRFVRNGQYSEVQRLLIEDQLDDADIRQQDYDREYRMVLTRLGILTGLGSADFACPAPEDLGENDLLVLLGSVGSSPLVLRAAAEAAAASETTKQFASENLPKLELGASLGYLDQTRLISPELENRGDYSAFAGISLPLFEGFKTDAGERAAAREQEAREQEREQAQLALDDFNARMDEEIDEGRDDLRRLLPEQTRAAQAVDLARDRYLNFLGPLSDLQQALKDRVTVDTQIAQVKTRLLLALGSKAFVNGAALRPQP